MNNDSLESVKNIFLDCMEKVYDSGVVHEYDVGDYFSQTGWVEGADNLSDLCEAFNTWVDQVADNNE